MPFIRDVSANYHSDKPSECYTRRYTCMVHVGTYIALRPHRGFRVMDPQYRDILELHCIILQKCSFGDPLPRLFKPFGVVKKHGCQGAGLIFPTCVYIYIENFKTLLVRNHRTDFNIYFCTVYFTNLNVSAD